MSFPATSPTKETSGVTFSVTSRRSLDCGRPTTGSDEGNSSRDFRMNRLAVHHFRYRAPTISREVHRVHWQADGQRSPGSNRRKKRTAGGDQRSCSREGCHCDARSSSGDGPKNQRPVLRQNSPPPLHREILPRPIPPVPAWKAVAVSRRRRHKDRPTRTQAVSTTIPLSIFL